MNDELKEDISKHLEETRQQLSDELCEQFNIWANYDDIRAIQGSSIL